MLGAGEGQERGKKTAIDIHTYVCINVWGRGGGGGGRKSDTDEHMYVSMYTYTENICDIFLIVLTSIFLCMIYVCTSVDYI